MLCCRRYEKAEVLTKLKIKHTQNKTATVEYEDGTEATIEQMALDVTEFLAWAADPKMETRKSVGIGAMIYLLILTILLWFAYKEVWRNVDH